VSASIGNGVISIGENAFESCHKLANVSKGDNVINIGQYAFAGCTALASVVIPNSVRTISDEAFDYCPSLTRVLFGNNVTSIGNYVFQFCYSLRSLYFTGNAPVVGWEAFGYNYDEIAYYLPGTTGWRPTIGDVSTVLWNPQMQTASPGFGVGTNGFGFTITGSSGLTVVVEACTNLSGPIWFPVGTNTLDGGSSYFSDPAWINFPSRFYRLRSP
jgi:hypothetical protein